MIIILEALIAYQLQDDIVSNDIIKGSVKNEALRSKKVLKQAGVVHNMKSLQNIKSQ